MKTTTILAFVIALSLLGLADSWYLAESAATDTPLVCGPGMLEGCNAVAQSEYSQLFGIPLGVYGVLFYALTLVLASAILFLKVRGMQVYLLGLTGAGALSSVAFLFIQFFLIKAFCVYCVLSAVISFVLVGLAFLIFKRAHVPASAPVPEAVAL